MIELPKLGYGSDGKLTAQITLSPGAWNCISAALRLYIEESGELEDINEIKEHATAYGFDLLGDE